MRENAIRAEVGGLRLSAILFDEAFRLNRKQDNNNLPPHRHADFELFLLMRGALSVTAEGKTVLASAPAAVILPPFLDHTTEGLDLQGYCMYFQLESKATQKGRKGDAASQLPRDRVHILPLSPAGIFYGEELAKTVTAPAVKGTESHLITLLFSEILSPILPLPRGEKTGKNLRYINIIDFYIGEHYREKIRLSDLARELYLCPKQIARIIQKKYGCSLSDLVRNHRLSLAESLLRTSQESISRIAGEVGYENANYFHTHFRKVYGLTPTEYRKNFAKKTP